MFEDLIALGVILIFVFIVGSFARWVTHNGWYDDDDDDFTGGTGSTGAGFKAVAGAV